MSKRINCILTTAEWAVVMEAIDAWSLNLEDEGEYTDEFAKRARSKHRALIRAEQKLRGNVA